MLYANCVLGLTDRFLNKNFQEITFNLSVVVHS